MDALGGSTSKGEPLDTPGGSASKGEPLKTLGGSASKGEPLETPGGSASKGEPLETPRGVGGLHRVDRSHFCVRGAPQRREQTDGHSRNVRAACLVCGAESRVKAIGSFSCESAARSEGNYFFQRRR